MAHTSRQLGRAGGSPKEGTLLARQTSICESRTRIKVGDEGPGTLPPRATHLIIGGRSVLRSTMAVTGSVRSSPTQTGNAVHETLDYRGLRRWSMLILFPILLLSSWVAALLFLFLAMPLLLVPFSAVAVAGIGMMGMMAAIVPPALGTVAGLLGVFTAKGKVVRHFKANLLPADHGLVHATRLLASRVGMACPEVYVYEDDDINAWATGTSPADAAIGISRGAIQRLSREHMFAVIGHELGHIAAADLRRMQFAVSFQNALVWFFGFRRWRWNAQHIFGFVGQFGIMGLSRRREYWADAVGAILTSSNAMKGALLAIQNDGKHPRKDRRYYNQLMFNWRGGSLLASHPTMDQRCTALDQGAFKASALQKMGAIPLSLQKPLQSRPRPLQLQPRHQLTLLDIQRYRAHGALAALALFFAVGGLTYYAYDTNSIAPAAQQLAAAVVPVPTPLESDAALRFVPKVAGWDASVSPAKPPAGQSAIETGALQTTARLPKYPKEPRYEPDGLMGDPELTPYQMLVEEGYACIHQANTDYKSEHVEDAGPDKSDLTLITLPLSVGYSDLIAGSIGGAISHCWKKHGGRQTEPDLMKRVKLRYDVWILTDQASGATAECGVWPVAREVRHKFAGMAAYCR